MWYGMKTRGQQSLYYSETTGGTDLGMSSGSALMVQFVPPSIVNAASPNAPLAAEA